MSNSDPNSAATVTPTPSLTTTATPTYTVRPSPSQPPPTPPPLPPPYRAIAPIHYPTNPFQQPHNNQFPNRRPNSPHQVNHQDPSPFVYPFVSPGRGYSTRPVRVSSPYVGENQSGYPPRPVMGFTNRQFGPGEMEAMMQFMRARNPQNFQVPYTGLGSPVGSGPMRGVPHFLQPRVAPPPTALLDTSRTKNARSRGDALVLVKGRKVRITEGSSVYSLCRSWLRNGAHEEIQAQRNNTMMRLPDPLPVEMMKASLPNDMAEEPIDENKEDEESVKQLSQKDLLKRHIERAKKVRSRLREERLRKIARYKARLALLLAQSGEPCKKND